MTWETYWGLTRLGFGVVFVGLPIMIVGVMLFAFAILPYRAPPWRYKLFGLVFGAGVAVLWSGFAIIWVCIMTQLVTGRPS